MTGDDKDGPYEFIEVPNQQQEREEGSADRSSTLFEFLRGLFPW